MSINNTLISQEDSKPAIRTGTDDFYKLLANSNVFVDKSLFIQEIIENSGDVILISRPRRWGKSLNMNMLKRFLEIEVDDQGNPLPTEQQVNLKLFIGGEIKLDFNECKILPPLKIAQNTNIMKRQGKFPVILLNLKDIKGNSYVEIEEKVRLNVRKLYKTHNYLINSQKISADDKKDFQNYLQGTVDAVYLQNNLVFLSALLFQHFGHRAYILIDEYDTPINSAYIKFGHNLEEFELVLDLFRSMLGSSLKSNHYLEKGVITGILRIAKANLFSDLNNLTENTLLDEDFSRFYGFTQEEVDELLSRVTINTMSPQVAIETTSQQIKDWYNGYTFGSNRIYNPWSIMQYLAHRFKLDYYWIDSGGTNIIDKILISDEVQEDLQNLLDGKGIVKNLYKQISLGDIQNNKTILYSLLVFSGYLNPTSLNNDPEDHRYILTIPNKEVSNIYIERVMSWVSNKLNLNSNDFDDFIGLLITQNLEQFGKKFKEYLINSTSYHDLLSERDYHNLMGGIIAPLARKYIINSNKESGFGRCDHLLIPKNPQYLDNANLQYLESATINKDIKYADSAIIIEYKITKNKKLLAPQARKGLEQIDKRDYASQIKQYPYIKKIIKIAMAFCGKDMNLQYRVDAI